MEVIKTDIEGVLIIEPRLFREPMIRFQRHLPLLKSWRSARA